MIVATAKVKLVIREARSLKEKRRVIKSLKDRIRHKFNVSIAEVEAQDRHQLAVLGVAVVANNVRFCNSLLSKVIDVMRQSPQAELVDCQWEVR